MSKGEQVGIRWSDIEAECGNYRDGFVAVFRKYEGEPTDEKDGQGRTVKVSVESFARHFGFDPKAFRRWVRAGVDARPAPVERAQMDVRRARSVVRNQPEVVVEAIMEAPEATQDAIYHELKLRRAGEDRTPANRKAATAAVNETLQPVRRGVATIGAALISGWLRDAAEKLEEAAREGALTHEVLADIDAAHEQFQLARAEVDFHRESVQ